MESLKSYLEELLALAQEQENALTQDDIERVQELGEKREVIINEIKRINPNHEPLIEEDRALLQKINIIDEKNNVELKKQFEQVKEELRKLNISSKRDKVYIDRYVGMNTGAHFDSKEN